LRAQIARITHSCSLTCKGLYKLNEENEREIEDNTPEEGEIKKPSVLDMANKEMWVHHTPSILNQGRLKHRDPKQAEGEEVEPEELMKREVAKDPWEPRLKTINKDKSTLGGIPAWILKSHNTTEVYLNEKTNKID
jgi:hypothetical protein